MSFYIPDAFRVADRGEIEAMIAADGFGHLITASDGPDDLPAVTPLPMMIEDGVLYGHVARANPHWRLFDGKRRAQALFPGPHAFVSASWYPEPARAVPTWNYTLARVTGRPAVLEDPARVDWLMTALSRRYEAADGWSPADAEPGFMAGMRRGIVAFEMAVETWEGKAKLSQNKPAEIAAVLAHRLEAAGDGAVAAAMRRQGSAHSRG